MSPSVIKSKCTENSILEPKGRVEVNKSLTRVFGVKEERDWRQQIQIINTNLVLQSEERYHGARPEATAVTTTLLTLVFISFFLTIRKQQH